MHKTSMNEVGPSVTGLRVSAEKANTKYPWMEMIH